MKTGSCVKMFGAGMAVWRMRSFSGLHDRFFEPGCADWGVRWHLGVLLESPVGDQDALCCLAMSLCLHAVLHEKESVLKVEETLYSH